MPKRLLYVKSAPGVKFTLERKPKTVIGSSPIAVESSHYYRKAIADKDIVEVSEKDWNDFLAARKETASAQAAKAAPTAALAPAPAAATSTNAAPAA